MNEVHFQNIKGYKLMIDMEYKTFFIRSEGYGTVRSI